jgi:apolipoprotein N-acyltransferase
MALETASPAGHSARMQVRSVRTHLIVAAVSLFLLLLAFPQPGWGWLAHLAFVPLTILALRSARPRMLAGTLYAVNAVWWIYMLRWLMPVTGGGSVLLALYMAVYLPLAMLFVRFLAGRYKCAMVLLLPLVWTSMEFIRGIFLSGGFGWYAISHTQAPFDPSHAAGRLMQVADLFGEHGVTFLVMMTNGWLVDLVSRPWVRVDGTGRRRRSRTVLASTLLWALSMSFAIGYGQFRIGQTPTDGPSLVVSVIQTDVPQSNKDRATYEQAIEDWTNLLKMTARAAETAPKPDLIVWSETVVPAAINEEETDSAYAEALYWQDFDASTIKDDPMKETFEAYASELKIDVEQVPGRLADYAMLRAEIPGHIKRMATALQTPIIVGASSRYRSLNQRFNSSYLALPSGEFAPMHYDKMYRVPFGEYVPWVENIGFLKKLFVEYLTPHKQDYSLNAGAGPVVFEVPVGGAVSADEAAEAELPATDRQTLQHVVRVVTPICFEDTIPRATRKMVYEGGVKQADLIANQTNDGWFAGSYEPIQHLQVATYRSVELRVPSVRSVNRGVSGFIDSSGRITQVVEVDGKREMVPGYANARVYLDARSTLFGRIGHWPVALCTLLTGALLAGGIFRHPARKRAGR